MRKFYRYKINLVVGNIVAILLFVLAVLPVSKKLFDYIVDGGFKVTGIMLGTYLFWMVFHEALHGIGHLLCGAKRKDLSYGASLEKGILFCLIRKEVNKKAILISLLFPFFFIGVVTYIIGLIIDSPLLLILSALNISGAGVDLIMFLNFIRLDKDITYIEPGDGTSFYLMSNNLKNKKLFGLILDEEGEYKEDMFKGEKYKTFDISKTSYIFFALIILMVVLCIFL